ncbi:hypothetical protein BpHYR1_032819 [Brachionus plicatilis]|uniref:Uncharacterized protein n=1 Tax=Brachionus plicatilis TaxID=10195 RepID=A0A3M7SHD4_BRAPC|nr:hypothetical protein BpHYR1_032819 [Brachionus plicatilis]
MSQIPANYRDNNLVVAEPIQGSALLVQTHQILLLIQRHRFADKIVLHPTIFSHLNKKIKQIKSFNWRSKKVYFCISEIEIAGQIDYLFKKRASIANDVINI